MERRHPVNLFVRDCITKALFRMMESGRYSDITVSSLVRTAGVSRNSFYRNYRSIEDILRQHLIEQTERWWAEYMAHPHPEVIREIFQHFLDLREVIRLLYSADLAYLLMEHIFLCGKQSLTGEVGNAYQTAFLSGGLWGLTNQWVLRGMRETPQEMQALFLSQGRRESGTEGQ